jgi:hypothetical protein
MLFLKIAPAKKDGFRGSALAISAAVLYAAVMHAYEVRPRKDKRGVKQKAFSKRCVHDPLQPTLQSAQAFPLSGAGHRAHTVTG